MKTVLLIGDGIAEKVRAGRKTSLELSHNPTLDACARIGVGGFFSRCPPGRFGPKNGGEHLQPSGLFPRTVAGWERAGSSLAGNADPSGR